MSVIINDEFVKKIREQLLVDLDNNKIIEDWFERIITIQFLSTRNVIDKIHIYNKDEIINICKKENELFKDIFPNNIDILEKNYPLHFYNEEMIKLLDENININTSVEKIIYYQEEFKNHERLFEFTSTNRNSDTVVTKDNITTVTQIFTPKWVSKYLIQNTIGSFDKYSLNNKEINYKEITILDPCLGAGQLIIEAFDYLWKKYNEDIIIDKTLLIKHIYKNQLFGFDIDKKVITLAKFIFLIKAIELCPNYCDKEVILPNFVTIEEFDIKTSNNEIKSLSNLFENASYVGSLIKTPNLDYDRLIKTNNDEKIKELLNIAKLLNKKYDVVITNPPYMGRKVLPKVLLKYLNTEYRYGKSELYTSFIERCLLFLNDKGTLAMLTLHTWMFIKSFASLRRHIIENYQLSSLIHLGKNTFTNLNAYNALASAFVINNTKETEDITFVKLDHLDDIKVKEKEFFNKENYFKVKQKSLFEIKDCPFIYWLTKNELEILKSTLKLGKVSNIRQGLATGDNKSYLRMWYEVEPNDICFNAKTIEEFHNSKKTYAPYNKGGDKTKWYCTSKTVIKFNKENYDILKNVGNHLPSKEWYFKEGITWSLFGFNSFNVRYKEEGYVFDVSGSSLFVNDELRNYILAYLSSDVAFYFLSAIAPTVNFQVGNIANLPFIYDESKKDIINKLVEEQIKISKELDSYDELSWNYKEHPFIKIYDKDKSFNENIYIFINYINGLNKKLNDNEKSINKIFNEIYKTNINYKKDKNIKLIDKDVVEELISYMIGIIFNRYQIDGYNYMLTNKEFIETKVINEELKLLIENIFNEKTLVDIEKILKKDILEYLNNLFGKYHIKKYNNIPIYWYKLIDGKIYIGYYHNLKDINKDLSIKDNYQKYHLMYKIKN
mgnify:CR=1 FL=1